MILLIVLTLKLSGVRDIHKLKEQAIQLIILSNGLKSVRSSSVRCTFTNGIQQFTTEALKKELFNTQISERGIKMEYTKFGEEMRVLRARRHQTIKDMVKIDLLCLNEGSYNGRQSVSSMWIIDKTKKTMLRSETMEKP